MAKASVNTTSRHARHERFFFSFYSHFKTPEFFNLCKRGECACSESIAGNMFMPVCSAIAGLALRFLNAGCFVQAAADSRRVALRR